ncbi:MAG TPA: 30S ribosome-binding factor RbfA [Synergistaceae bacterium]|nr:30S ribosome-binding factor RbfA [Synergistaceae bacterium]
MTTFRMQRINKQIQRDISLLLSLRVQNEIAKQAIITDVDCSRDLEQAKVYFTTLDPSMTEDVGRALASVAGLLRSGLAKSLTVRQVPVLSFVPDRSEQYGRSMDALLDSLKVDPSAHGDEGYDEDEESEVCDGE